MARHICPKCTSLEVRCLGFGNRYFCETCTHSWDNPMTNAMTYDYINGYKDGFLNRIDMQEHMKFSIFGMQADEVLTIIAEHRKKPTLAEKLLADPELAKKREAFRKELSDLGHSEATTYDHWALRAFDIAHNLR